jgi:CheY-like chemotaxis protein
MRPVNILLVEDNEGDIVLTQEAFEESRIKNEIFTARNGKEAVDFVFKNKGFENVPTPDVILMDINLPLKNGIEALTEIKANSLYKHIPVIMLTTSSAERDISMAYDHHANCYITKPVDVSKFLEAILSMEHFWLNIVTLAPSR